MPTLPCYLFKTWAAKKPKTQLIKKRDKTKGTSTPHLQDFENLMANRNAITRLALARALNVKDIKIGRIEFREIVIGALP